MKTRTIVVALVVLGLAFVASPVVGTASADVCRAGDVECHERKANCYLGAVRDPTDPPLCTA